MGKEGRIERGSNEEGWRRLRASQKISQRYFPRFTFPKDGITLNVKVVGRVNFEGRRATFYGWRGKKKRN